jgi:hypothetical protein
MASHTRYGKRGKVEQTHGKNGRIMAVNHGAISRPYKCAAFLPAYLPLPANQSES